MSENNYLIPDPTWDYAPIWENLQHTKSKFENLLNYMAEIEDGNSLTNKEILDKLVDIRHDLLMACEFTRDFSNQP